MKKAPKIKLLYKALYFWLLVFSVSTIGYSSEYINESKSIKTRWKSNLIKISISNSLLKSSSNFKSETDVSGAIKRSLEHWESIANIQFIESSSDKQTTTQKGSTGDGVNLITIAPTPDNLLLFSGNPTEISARTRVFFNRKGFITEADIVLNPYQQFSTDGSFGTFDLESILTHEIGHLLGLDHSFVIGSTMQSNQAKNGIYSLPAYLSRSLAEDDITAIRGLYGAKNDEGCCGSVTGKISTRNSLMLWLKNDETGIVSAGFTTKSDGGFRLDGIKAGKYTVFAQDGKLKSSVENLGEFVIEKGKTLFIENHPKFIRKSFEISHIGFNFQLTNVAVPINPGKTYLIFIGGVNLNPVDYELSFDSPYIKTNHQSLTSRDFGSEISVLSFEIEVSPQTPVGEYAIKVKKSNGEVNYLIGGLSNDGNFVNNWNNKILFSSEE